MPDSAPTALTEVAARVDTRLHEVLAAEHARWEAQDPRLAEMVAMLTSIVNGAGKGGGKRMRAAFCYWAFRGVAPEGADETKIIDAGCAFELMQAFALIHDDIMDDAAMRRGVPTIHHSTARDFENSNWQGESRRYSEGVAILAGDLSHVYADRLIQNTSTAARAIWDELRIELNLGQYLDLRSAASGDRDAETARAVATFKSALYTIVRPLQFGVSLDGPASQELLDQLDRFGRPLGRAFQLRDDLLGVVGDPQVLGKPVGDDIREGKPTEILATALERADAAQMAKLGRVGSATLTSDEITEIIVVLNETGALAHIEQKVALLVQESMMEAQNLPFSDDVRSTLEALANYVACRNH